MENPNKRKSNSQQLWLTGIVELKEWEWRGFKLFGSESSGGVLLGVFLMVTLADKLPCDPAVEPWSLYSSAGNMNLSDSETSIDLTTSVCRAECGLPGVWRRARTRVPEHHMASDGRARCSVQPRADQSKHTNETLIGLYFRSWLSAPSFPSPSFKAACVQITSPWPPHTLLPFAYACFYVEVHVQYTLVSVCSFREIRNAKSLTYIDPEAFKNLPNLKYLWVFFIVLFLKTQTLFSLNSTYWQHYGNLKRWGLYI